MIVSPCNGSKHCRRHSCGCAKIVLTAREEYAIRQRYKARRRRLWSIVLNHYRLRSKWSFSIGSWRFEPIPRQHHLAAVLLMEEALDDYKMSQLIKRRDLNKKQEQKVKGYRHNKHISYFLGKDL